jgi:hypothetical protein
VLSCNTFAPPSSILALPVLSAPGRDAAGAAGCYAAAPVAAKAAASALFVTIEPVAAPPFQSKQKLGVVLPASPLPHLSAGKPGPGAVTSV